MNQCNFFCDYHCTHAKDNKKSILARNYMFFTHPQEFNLDIISNVITFLALRVKV